MLAFCSPVPVAVVVVGGGAAAVAVAAPALFFAWIHFTNMENVIGAELRHQEIGQVYQHKISLTPIFT